MWIWWLMTILSLYQPVLAMSRKREALFTSLQLEWYLNINLKYLVLSTWINCQNRLIYHLINWHSAITLLSIDIYQLVAISVVFNTDTPGSSNLDQLSKALNISSYNALITDIQMQETLFDNNNTYSFVLHCLKDSVIINLCNWNHLSTWIYCQNHLVYQPTNLPLQWLHRWQMTKKWH